MSWIDEKAHAELARIREANEKQVYPFFREFETGGLHTTIDGQPIVNFSSNDYLGLTNHPKVKEAAHKAVDKYACGLSSSRVQATTIEHVELEQRLAKWFGFEKCLHLHDRLPGDGRHASSSLADKDTTLVLDTYSHACILDGTFLAAGMPGRAPEVRFFNHNSAKSLERILKTRERKNAHRAHRGRLLARRRQGSHAGDRRRSARATTPFSSSTTRTAPARSARTARGILEETGLEGKVPLVVSTFSKTFGGIGGILLGGRRGGRVHPEHGALVPLQRLASRPDRRRGVAPSSTCSRPKVPSSCASCTRRPPTCAASSGRGRLRSRREQHAHHAGHTAATSARRSSCTWRCSSAAC